MSTTPFQKSPYFLPALIAAASVIAIGAAAFVMSQSNKVVDQKDADSSLMSQNSSFDSAKVTDFTSCVAKTGLTLESFPAQCSNYSGTTYTQEIAPIAPTSTDIPPAAKIDSKPAVSGPRNNFTNEVFTVQSGGQMRYKEDASGGLELVRKSDGQVYAVLNSLILKNDLGVNLVQGVVVTMDGTFISVDSDFGGGSGNAKFVITSFNLAD